MARARAWPLMAPASHPHGWLLSPPINWQGNRLVRQLAAAGGLTLRPPGRPGGGGGGSPLALYDGRELVFTESG